MFKSKDIDIILQALRAECAKDSFWSRFLNSGKSAHAAIHLGIFVEPYISYILDGKKTIESRFSINRIAPYETVRKGDLLLLKRSGGPIVGICLIGDVWFYELEESSWREIKREYREQLCAHDPQFWHDRASASFASLMTIHNAQQIGPMGFVKRDRRGWVVLRSSREEELCL